jgi:hypothetical protein
VPAGTLGTIRFFAGAEPTENDPGCVAYTVRWEGREVDAFCAGSRVRAVAAVVVAGAA